MKKSKQTVFSFFWSVVKPYKWWYLLMLQAPVCGALYPVLCNYAVKNLIDIFTQHEKVTYQQAFKPIFYFVIAQLMIDGGWRLHNLASLNAMPYIFQNTMCKVFNYISHHSYTFFQNNFSGSIISKVKGIGDGYANLHAHLQYRLMGPLLTAIFAGGSLYLGSKKIFYLTVVFLSINIPFCLFFYVRLARLEQILKDSYHNLIGKIADKVSNIFTIFAFATRERESKAIYNYYQSTHNQLQVKVQRYDFYLSLVSCIMYEVYIISLFVYLIYLRNHQEIFIGDIAFIVTLSYVFTNNVWTASVEVKEFIKNLAELKSSFSLLKISHENLDKPHASRLMVKEGEIFFNHIYFGYPNGQKVFQGLTLKINAGEKVGLVGGSGSGKSTLISLLLKNFLVDKGDILIDGQSIYDVTSDSLRRNISFIPQDIMLFHRSIGENIGYAKDNATYQDIVEAAKKADIHEFIMRMPQQYDTLVGERGVKLSGGQRQRIAIARAMLKHAPILILDEATSSLDTETEQQIQNSINLLLEETTSSTATKGVTVIAIAHRLSTIKHMDRIVVLQNGSIIESGRFTELIAKPHGRFKQLWEYQAETVNL